MNLGIKNAEADTDVRQNSILLEKIGLSTSTFP